MNLTTICTFQTFFRKLEHLTVEGDVHLNAFAFLWAHCQALKYLRIGRHCLLGRCHGLNYVALGLVIADEMTNANVLIMDVFTALFRVGFWCYAFMEIFNKSPLQSTSINNSICSVEQDDSA